MQDELKHYGVLGMRWGTRRSKEVKAVKKAWKKEKRRLNDEDMQNFHKALVEYNKVSADRRAAIKDAKRNKGDVKAVKREWDSKLDAIDNKYDHDVERNAQKYKDAKANFKKQKTLAREKAANRLYGDGEAARNKRIVNQSFGKSLVQTFLMGSYGAKKYNQYRAEGSGRVASAAKGALWNAANQATLGRVSKVSDHAAKSKRYHDRRKEKVAKRLARQK